MGWNGICQSKIGINYIKEKINLLETGDGMKLVFVVLYKFFSKKRQQTTVDRDNCHP